MINILLFASLREELGCGSLQFEIEEHCTISHLMERLASKDAAWQLVFSKPNVMIAVNQQMADKNTQIEPGDEIAFFPPVTGG